MSRQGVKAVAARQDRLAQQRVVLKPLHEVATAPE
jgi:hypothetical protein